MKLYHCVVVGWGAPRCILPTVLSCSPCHDGEHFWCVLQTEVADRCNTGRQFSMESWPRLCHAIIITRDLVSQRV